MDYAQPKIKKFDKLFSAESKLGLKVQRQEAQEMTSNVKAAIAFVDKMDSITTLSFQKNLMFLDIKFLPIHALAPR